MPKPTEAMARKLAERINADPRIRDGRYNAGGLTPDPALGWYAVVTDSLCTTAYPSGRVLNVYTWTQWEAIITERPAPLSGRRARPVGRK